MTSLNQTLNSLSITNFDILAVKLFSGDSYPFSASKFTTH